MTQQISGRYFDGCSAAHVDATLAIDAAGLLELQPPAEPAISIREVKVSSRLGNVPRQITFPSSAVFETAEQDAVDDWLRRHGVTAGVAHWLESRIGVALGALALVAAFVVAAAIWGIPWLSGVLAPMIPPQVVRTVGSQTLAYLDRLVLGDSELGTERRADLESMFADLAPAESEFDYHLEFRRGGLLQANAFALPDGSIVATDELVNLLGDNEQIAAVLTHEIGHVEHRHGLELVLSHSGLAAVTLLVLGDVNAAGAVVVALPSILVGSSYSRKLESEADDYALRRLAEIGIPAARFADALEGLRAFYERDCAARARAGVLPPRHCDTESGDSESEALAEEDGAQDSGAPDTEGPRWLDYISTHPATAERIAKIRGAR